MSGKWTALKHQPTFNASTMLLLTTAPFFATMPAKSEQARPIGTS